MLQMNDKINQGMVKYVLSRKDLSGTLPYWKRNVCSASQYVELEDGWGWEEPGSQSHQMKGKRELGLSWAF